MAALAAAASSPSISLPTLWKYTIDSEDSCKAIYSPKAGTSGMGKKLEGNADASDQRMKEADEGTDSLPRRDLISRV